MERRGGQLGCRGNHLGLLIDGTWVRETARSEDDSRILPMALVLAFCFFACFLGVSAKMKLSLIEMRKYSEGKIDCAMCWCHFILFH